ncbi:hypothetical protein MMC11_008430 [Xylographa trunciseda]|nr:hypothetical protein [Xylographa trunciseda]
MVNGVPPVATINSQQAQGTSIPVNVERQQQHDRQSNASTGASAAGVRAITARLISLYFRAPAKAFFRNRVDYLAFARAVNPHFQANGNWSWHVSTPGILSHAIGIYGWGFIPNQLIPPLLANTVVGTVAYTSYLQFLGTVHAPSSDSSKRVFPPPPIGSTFVAGFAAGSIQSVVAAPIDALQVRFQTKDMVEGRYKNMWQYGYRKLRELGVRRIFAGWGLSLARDSLGFGAFFATFEYVKAQSFYAFVTRYYGGLDIQSSDVAYRQGAIQEDRITTIRPHYALEPSFLMLAGFSASAAQQVIQYPISMVQNIYGTRLESIDRLLKESRLRSHTVRHYGHAYRQTFRKCSLQAHRVGGWRRLLYQGFVKSTLKQVPSTSAGLVVFELVRRRYANEAEAVRIEKDGYDILLT